MGLKVEDLLDRTKWNLREIENDSGDSARGEEEGIMHRGHIDRQTDGRTDGRTDRQTDRQTLCFIDYVVRYISPSFLPSGLYLRSQSVTVVAC